MCSNITELQLELGLVYLADEEMNSKSVSDKFMEMSMSGTGGSYSNFTLMRAVLVAAFSKDVDKVKGVWRTAAGLIRGIKDMTCKESLK